MQLLTLNAAGKSLAPPQTLDPRRRRLSQVIGRHVDRSRPHMIAIQRARDPLQPIGEAWVARGRDKAGNVKPWPRRYLPADAIVVVVYGPRGGAAGGGGARGRKSPLSIALGIAGIALAAFAGPIAGALLPSLIFGSTATFALQAGLVIGGTALLSLASRAKANKQATDTTQIYGIAGGGNLPKPGDRIPRGYGRSWMKPDLSQPDFSQYDGDDQILFKRQTIGLGRYRPYQVRAGKQVMWEEGQGFIAPFDDSRNRIEFLYGTASTLVPSNVISAAGVGGTLPRPADNPTIAGPFNINPSGALIARLQVDFQFPQGISATNTRKSGNVYSNQKADWSVLFEYAPIDASGAVTGAWQTLYDGSSATEGQRFSTHPLRYTKFKDVPAGRYAVRGRNRLADTSAQTGVGSAQINAAQWDGASGWVNDVAVRPGITEVAMRIYATKGNQASAFGEIEIDAGAIIPVWTGSQWVEQETSKSVWAYLDIMRNADYGGAISDDQLDLGTALYYAGALTEFDTFDATIRGPVSVYEAAATVLLTMRAEPVHLGRFWSLVRDEPKSVRRHMITRRQMLKGSSQITFDLDTAAGAGHVIGEFDDGGDYRKPNQSTAIYGEASLTPTRQRWTGVKTYAHNTHLTRWRAASGAYRRQAAPFGVEMEGRIYKRGDSIGVDVWFIDQVRTTAGVLDNLGDKLILDSDATLASGDMATLRDRSGREWGPLAITQGASAREVVLNTADRQAIETQSGLTLAKVLSDGRRDMTAIRIGQPAALAENYLIQSVKHDGARRAQVEALIDDPRVWTAIGAAVGTPPVGYSGILEPESPSILKFTASATPVAAGFRADYAIQPGRGARTFEVGLSYDGGNRFDTRGNADIAGSITLNPVDPTTITMRARAFGPSGLPGAYVYTSISLPAAGINVALPPIAYDDLGTDVRQRFVDLQAAADSALTTANGRLDSLRRSLAADPKIRAGFIDIMIGDIRRDVAVLADATSRNLAELAMLGDRMAAAGIEVVSAEGRVRIAAVSQLANTFGTQITSLSVTVDALKGQIDLYGSVQTSDLSGLVTAISTVQQNLNALTGTITTLATTAQFDALSTRLSSAQQTIDGQAAAIDSKASQTTVSAQGTRLTQAETRLSAAEGRISSVVSATGSGAVDTGLLPRLVFQLGDVLGLQLGAIQANLARAETNVSANFDAAGRATAELSTRLLVFQGDATAQFASVTKAVTDLDSALVATQTLYLARFGSIEASVASEVLVRAAADSAQTTRTDGALSRIGSAESSITSLASTVATNQSASAQQFSGISTQFAGVTQSINSLASSTSAADQAIGSRIDTVTTRLGNAEAATASEIQARVSADGALSSRIDAVSARAENANALVTSETQARVAGDQANASSIQTVAAQTAAGTAGGRVGFTAVSGPSGVTARYAIQVSTQAGGQMNNAGLFIDILSNGQSRIVMDANCFLLTANGGLTYPFQFDGQTLTIPGLRVTGDLIVDGAVSIRDYRQIGNTSVGTGNSAGTTGTALTATVNVGTKTGILVSVTSSISVTAAAPNNNTNISTQLVTDLYVDGNKISQVNNINVPVQSTASRSSTGTDVSTYFEVLDAGSHTIELRYRYTSGGSGANNHAEITSAKMSYQSIFR